MAAAVDGLKTSGFVTVVLFTCTSWGQQAAAFCDTVATGNKVNLKIFWPYFFNAKTLAYL